MGRWPSGPKGAAITDNQGVHAAAASCSKVDAMAHRYSPQWTTAEKAAGQGQGSTLLSAYVQFLTANYIHTVGHHSTGVQTRKSDLLPIELLSACH